MCPARTACVQPAASVPSVQTRQSVSFRKLNQTNPTTFGWPDRYSAMERIQADWSPPQFAREEAVWAMSSGVVGAIEERISSRYGPIAWAGVSHGPRQFPKLYAEIPITSAYAAPG